MLRARTVALALALAFGFAASGKIGTPEPKAAITARKGVRGALETRAGPLAIGGVAIGAVALLALVARSRG